MSPPTANHPRAVVLAVALGAAFGCYPAGQIRAQNQVIEHDLDLARHSNAYRCAPRELAAAEANLEFSERELSDGHPLPAHQFNVLAQQNVQQALELSKGCGPPESRLAAAIPSDRDSDGVPDDLDRCPDDPGPKENFGCPWGDRDQDGVPDNLDKCPDLAGIPELQGCPDIDTDGDGVADRVDRCPRLKGLPELQGCPDKDSDGDGFLDRQDRCPEVPGVAPDGCPRKYRLVVVRRDRIEIRQQVHFASNKSRILKDSFDLLNQVAAVLNDSPQLQIQVQGHTDNVGGQAHNLKLSQERAAAVRGYLIKQGISAERLVARGFGARQPIASNATKAGKLANRRVEFRLVLPEATPAAVSEPAPPPTAVPPASPVPGIEPAPELEPTPLGDAGSLIPPAGPKPPPSLPPLP